MLPQNRNYAKHGNLLVNISDNKVNGVVLGRWFSLLRTYRKSNIQRAYLTPERIRDWMPSAWFGKKPEPWLEKFSLVEAYYDQHGNTSMPTDFVVEGVWLRRWLTEQNARLNEKPTSQNRTVKKPTAEQRQCLRSVEILPAHPPPN